jgi:hypothetical protein
MTVTCWPTRVEAPWKAMTDTALATVKTNGTVVLLASGLLVIAGFWNGTEWQTESGITLNEPWKWMPMPEPIST